MADVYGGASSSDLTQPTVTLLAASIGVSGALAGLVVERFLRSFGRPWCVPSGWELKFMTPHNVYGETTEVNLKEAEAASADYSVSLDLLNGKEIPVGLRDISVVFTHDDGELVNKPWTRGVPDSPVVNRLPTRLLR